MIPDSRQVFYAPAADQYDRVFLKIMSFSTDVRGHLHTIGKPDAGDLAQRGVRLLGGGGIDPGAYTSFLRTTLKRRYGTFSF
jgi:hypothetical protein